MDRHSLRRVGRDRPSFEHRDLSLRSLTSVARNSWKRAQPRAEPIFPDRPSDRRPHHFDDLIALLIIQMRINRQRENPLRLFLRDWKLAGSIAKILIASH